MKDDDVNGRADAPPAGSAAGLADALQDLLTAIAYANKDERSASVHRAHEQLRAYDASLRGEVAVWITSHAEDRSELVEALAMRDGSVLGRLHYLPIRHGDMACHGWVRVGTASITMQATSQSELLDGHVKALRAQQAEARARAQAVDTEFERQIQCLLAIDLKPAGGAS